MIELVLVRHAQSCSNAKEYDTRGKLHKLLVLQQANPHLSDLGLAQIQQAKKAKNIDGQTLKSYINSAHMICSSDMLRAMETAYNLCPNREIVVLPFVGEKAKAKLFIHMNLDVENKPQGPIDSVKRLKALKYDTTHFDYELYFQVTQGRIPFPNVRKFFQKIVMDHWFNPNSPFHVRDNNTVYRIVIVSHGHFLRELVAYQTQAMFHFWHSPPLFKLPYCKEFQGYKPSRPAIGNVGMFALRFLPEDIEKFLSKKKRLKAPENIFETNAVYDETTQTCLPYNSHRFILPEYGYKHHVSRCDKVIRNIPTLKQHSNNQPI
jgi:broad specificity phosphatase PhoE